MFSKGFWNFAIGMILGVFANYFWFSSTYMYYFVFAPCAIIIFILINYELYEQKQTKLKNKQT